MARVDYGARVKHDGKLHAFSVHALEIPRCGHCGEMVFTEAVDRQITDALRRHLHLLTPDEIRSSLAQLNMTQRDLARDMSVAEETVSRWCTSAVVPSRSMDRFLRAYFASPETRNTLQRLASHPDIGASAVTNPSRLSRKRPG
ncbi:MAG: hypothetical protein WD066_08780 [Planctomycetaceae bacterium]